MIKGGIRDAWNATHYRGISIIDTIGKFLERLIFFRIRQICGAKIHENQSGGLAQNGSVQQIIRVVTAVEEHIHHTDWNERGCEFRDRHVVMALLDCSKAFDRMHRAVLLDKFWAMAFGVDYLLFWLLICAIDSRE